MGKEVNMKKAYEVFRQELDSIRESGMYKNERIITTPQKARIDTTAARNLLNICANNYRGLSNHPEIIAAARQAMTNGAMGCPPCALFAAHRKFTSSLREKSQTSWKWTTVFCIHRALTLTAACSKRF